MLGTRARYQWRVIVAGVVLAGAMAAPVLAQPATTAPADPNPGRITLTGSVDAVSTYMFRGIRQHSTGIALWPVADIGLAVYSSDDTLKSVGVNIGSWNSLNTGDTGADGPTGKLWYESDFYSTVTVGFAAGTSVGATYTAYTSPNNAFTTVKELAFKVSVDDSGHLGKAALKPYALVAFEFDTSPGRRRSESWTVSRTRRDSWIRRFKADARRAGEGGPQPRGLLRAEHRHGDRPGLRRQQGRVLQRGRPRDPTARWDHECRCLEPSWRSRISGARGYQ